MHKCVIRTVTLGTVIEQIGVAPRLCTCTRSFPPRDIHRQSTDRHHAAGVDQYRMELCCTWINAATRRGWCVAHTRSCTCAATAKLLGRAALNPAPHALAQARERCPVGLFALRKTPWDPWKCLQIGALQRYFPHCVPHRCSRQGGHRVPPQAHCAWAYTCMHQAEVLPRFTPSTHWPTSTQHQPRAVTFCAATGVRRRSAPL
jgi:hypothetical protein